LRNARSSSICEYGNESEYALSCRLMTVQCAHCGEPLLGSVNRCWKCGRSLIAHAGPADVPPVRRSPIVGPLDGALPAILLDEPAPAGLAAAETAPEGRPPVRKGSPFAVATSPTAPSRRTRSPFSAEIPTYRPNPSTHLAGRMSILLGVIALAIAYPFWPGGLAIAAAGIGFAIWSLNGQKRVAACIGLTVCLSALIFALYVLSISW
jgi:hypothetical protein